MSRFLEWCDNDLNTSMSAEIALALKIFSGNSAFRKTIALDNTTQHFEKVFKTIWGTAWDFTHMRVLQMIKINLGVNPKTYFITRDKNISLLFKNYELGSAITQNSNPSVTFNSNLLDCSFLSEETQIKLERLLQDFLNSRIKKLHLQDHVSIEAILPLARKLEAAISNHI